MNYKITVKCTNEAYFSERLALGIQKAVEARCVYDAAFSVIEEVAEEILKREHPRMVWLETTGISDAGEPVSFHWSVCYEPHEVERISGSGYSFLDESYVYPYTIVERPTSFERLSLDALSAAFPDHKFKYFREKYFCKLNEDWVDILEYLSTHGSNEEEYPIFDGLNSDDEELKMAYRKQQMLIIVVEKIRDHFFKPQDIMLDIKKYPSLSDFTDI